MGKENKYKEAIPDALWTLLAILLAYIAPILLFNIYVFNGPVSLSNEIWRVLKIGAVILGSASLFVGIPLFASSIVWLMGKIAMLKRLGNADAEVLKFDAQLHGFILFVVLPLVLFFMSLVSYIDAMVLISAAAGATAFSAVLAIPGYKEYKEKMAELEELKDL